MSYYSSGKKKIRGWKRHVRKIEQWKQRALHLDMDHLALHERDYEKLWIHPFYALERRNPPLWYRKLLLEAMIDVYLSWHDTMTKTNEDFHLKIWLYYPNFINSQIVVAYRECINFYDTAFEEQHKMKEFPYHQYTFLREKLEMFDWKLHVESEHHFESDWIEWIEADDASEEELMKIRNQAHETKKIEYEDGSSDTLFIHYVGDVWVGTLKNTNI